MKRTPITYLFISLLFLTWTCTSPETSLQSEPPNIVIIFTDDQGYGDIGVYGHPTIKTPHLDEMATEGAKFTQFYVGASVCTPSRAALLTGRLPIRSGMASDRIRVLFPFSYKGIPDSEITIAEALRDQGYATGMVGKWHLGHLPPYLPTKHGFDSYFGIPYSNDMRRDPESGWAPVRKYPPLPLLEDTTTIEVDIDQTVLTKRYTEKAVAYIEAQAKSKQPFFLYLAHNMPHIPLYASEAFAGKSTRGLYGDVIEEIDWSVGQILEALKTNGIDKNTFVFFTSDNGPWLTFNEEGGSAGLLKGGKGATWEGGMREPAIAWWPGKIEPGQTIQSLATTMDVYATALDIAGAPLPSDRTMDGSSLMPILMGEKQSIRDEVYYYLGEQLYAIRKGPWKMHYKTFTAYVGQKAVTHDPPILYNLEHDPSEQYEIGKEHPEVIQQLQEAAQKHLESVQRVPSLLNDIDTSYFAN